MKNWFYEQMAMYSAYHRDGRNQATHHVGVPMIVFSVLVITSTIPLVTTVEGPITVGAALMALLVLFYIIAAPLVGTIAALLYGALSFGAAQIAAMGEGIPMKVFLTLFIVGWAIQFWGHKYEGRKPALFDNLLQIFMAPSFLIAEILFSLGLEEGLQAEIKSRMGKYLPKEG
ncbi:Mpo1 family 2-hydroxy fatty acid dioxygenase [Kordiimonas gwangyangensis]|uniref:Mpo1 family 2-hydroxy fatty acid dioxygenase n=1 Tax=Kordiimonas gwangyangensis TaxID=288022 RepID=UPI000372C54E|nr:Mpo1-like protein [Kordiimonas gwangyangensis]